MLHRGTGIRRPETARPKSPFRLKRSPRRPKRRRRSPPIAGHLPVSETFRGSTECVVADAVVLEPVSPCFSSETGLFLKKTAKRNRQLVENRAPPAVYSDSAQDRTTDKQGGAMSPRASRASGNTVENSRMTSPRIQAGFALTGCEMLRLPDQAPRGSVDAP